MPTAKISKQIDKPLHLLTPEAKAEVASAIRKLLAFVENQWPMGTCPCCEHFKEGYCARWQASPPRERWDEGCDEWSDPIPF